MEISQDVIIDTILNAIGYLAAGGLAIAVYSTFGKRQKLLSPASDRRCIDHEDVLVRSGNHREGNRRLEFVRFDQTRTDSESAQSVVSEPAARIPADARRNRAEVIGLARKLIDAGASADRIRSVLPISEAELALLSCNRN